MSQDTQIKTTQALELLGIQNRKTLWKHAKRLNIATDRGWYWLSEVEAIQQAMVSQGLGTDTMDSPEEAGAYYRDETAASSNDAIVQAIAPYQPMIHETAVTVATALHQQLHQEIAREFFKIANQPVGAPPLVQAAQRSLAAVKQSGLLLLGSADAPVHAIAPH